MTDRDYTDTDRLEDLERALERERELNERYAEALSAIAGCESHVYGDLVSIAQTALWTPSSSTYDPADVF